MPTIPLSRLTKVRRLLLQNSLAARTRTEYRGKVLSYISFCRLYHLVPWPATEDTLSTFLSYLFLSNQAVSSIKCALSAIKKEQQVTRCLPWVSPEADQRLRLLIKGASRSSPKPIKRANPITSRILKPMIRALDPSRGRHVIHAAMWATAHDGLLRISELLNLRLRDVHFFPSKIILDLHDAKNHKGQATPQQVCLNDTGSLSAYRLLKAYSSRFALPLFPTDFFLFPLSGRKLESHVFGTRPMSVDSFTDFLTEHLLHLGLSPSQLHLFTSHSFRAGGATDLHLQGIPVDEIMRRGRWRSSTYKLYIRPEAPEVIALLASTPRALTTKSQLA